MAGPVALTTQVAGPAPAAWGNSVKALTDAFLNPAHGMFYQTAATTSIANSTTVWTAIAFDAELADTQNGHSTTVNNTRYTCQAGWAGLYVVQGNVFFTGNATGIRYAAVGVNGVVPQAGSPDGMNTVANAGQIVVSTYAEVTLAVGDYVQLLGIQSSGGALATVISSPFTSSMTVRWVAAA